MLPSTTRTRTGLSLLALAMTVSLTPSLAAAATPTGDPSPPLTNGYAHAVPPGTVHALAPAGRPAPGGRPLGMDVSNVNSPKINVAEQVAAGVKFAYVKASEGVHFTDGDFAMYSGAARNSGIYVGAYHYARPDRSNGTAQADYFLDRAGYVADGRTLPPMLDIEWPWEGSGSTWPCYGLTPAAMSQWIREFVTRVQARTNVLPMLYTNRYWWQKCTNDDPSFGNLPLFIANYNNVDCPELPAGWNRWTLWQYQVTAVPHLDWDVFNGSMADLAVLASGKLVPQNAPGWSFESDGAQHAFGRGANGNLLHWFWSAQTGPAQPVLGRQSRRHPGRPRPG